ncbi:MAG: hypothetical protein JSS95_08240 [Acidobacteria bacterium]|nr:hypothetical protein [Acidobacteriota bacterium]
MRKLLVLIAVALVVVLAINRQRVFLRDPLGKVTKNGVETDDARVYINYSNDVLVEEPGGQRTYIVQNWNKVPGTPRAIACLRGIVCWTDADHPQMVPLGSASYSPDTVMSDREVSFNDGYGIGIRVTLR